MAEEKIIGIDLGTTNSVVAVMEGGEVKVIPNQEGNRLTPSVVAFTDKGDRLVGDPAKRQAVTNPRRTIYSIKRFMGRRHKEVADEEKLVPYKIVGGAGGAGQGRDRRQDLRAAGDLRDDPAQAEGGGRGVPGPPRQQGGHHGAGVLQRRPAPGDAGGGGHRRLRHRMGDRRPADGQEVASSGCGSSTSRRPPSLAYGLDKKKHEKIAVFDLGGGTFDISILEIDDGVFQVLSTNGDTHLGGDDFDQVLIDYIAEEFKKENGIDLRKDQMALQRLKEAAERAKKDLSQQATTDINLPFITADASGPEAPADDRSRGAKFEQMVDHLIERCRKPVLQALKDAKLKPNQIDEVVMVGGMTRMPRVQWLVKDIFGKEGHRGVNPDEVVAIGAAIQGRSCCWAASREVLLVDVTPLSLGIETRGRHPRRR